MLIGVHSVAVALLAARADIQYFPDQVSPLDIARAITQLGFPSEVLHDSDSHEQELELTVN